MSRRYAPPSYRKVSERLVSYPVGGLTPATGPVEHTGTGAATLPLPTASGAAKRSLLSTGAATLPLVTAAGAGKKARPGSGAATLPLLTASGAGKKARASTGAAVLPFITASGAGEVTEPGVTDSGSGAATLPLLPASGAAKRTLRGSGAPSLTLITASGAGKKARPGSGAATLPLLTATGAAKRALKATGTPSLTLITAAGVGEVVADGVFTGSGAPALPLLTASGAGETVAAEAPPAPEEVTGGGSAYFRAEQAALQRKYDRERAEEEERERQEAEELRALAERLEAHLVETGVLSEADARADLVRLRGLASQYVPSDLPRRAQRAIAYAERAKSDLAVQLALRELARVQEEEELALLLVLAAA